MNDDIEFEEAEQIIRDAYETGNYEVLEQILKELDNE